VCGHCGARLATIACPTCFDMMFQGSRFCPHCGAAAVAWEPTPTPQLCPGCEHPLLRGQLGELVLHECDHCFGFWVDTHTFEHICRNAEQEALGLGLLGPPTPRSTQGVPGIRYVRCPQCRQLMHRVNFAQHSGVVVDVCRDHGTWFDADELHRIVHFIRTGGLDRARERQQAELADERRRLEATRRAYAPELPGAATGERPLFPEVIRATGGLLDRWLKR
jgi:Zn-finger nucleic acid-binding protein